MQLDLWSHATRCHNAKKSPASTRIAAFLAPCEGNSHSGSTVCNHVSKLVLGVFGSRLAQMAVALTRGTRLVRAQHLCGM